MSQLVAASTHNNHGSAAMYRGDYYDSVTEARMAAYFDHAGMAFVHEPETFLLVDEILYTPDFYLPAQDTYVEVKNGPVSLLECTKAAYVARGIGKAVLLINGSPQNMVMYGYAPDSRKKMPFTGVVLNYAQATADYVWDRRMLTGAPLDAANPLAAQVQSHIVGAMQAAISTEIDASVKRASKERKVKMRQNPYIIALS